MRIWNWADGTELYHYGIKGQKWGVQNGPPYPLDQKTHSKVVNGLSSDTRKRLRVKNEPEYGLPKTSKKFIQSNYENHPIESVSSMEKIPDDYLNSDSKMFSIKYQINHPKDEDDTGRHYNCPNCSIAFDMVERGYLVTARPKLNGSNVGDIEKAWKGDRKLAKLGVDDFGKELYRLYDRYQNANRFTMKKRYKQFNDAYYKLCETQREGIIKTLQKEPNGSRGVIVVGWRMDENPSTRTSSYHALNYKIIDNKVVFFDAQSRRSSKIDGYTDSKWILEDCDPREIYYMRTSDLDLSDDVGNYVYSNRSL